MNQIATPPGKSIMEILQYVLNQIAGNFLWWLIYASLASLIGWLYWRFWRRGRLADKYLPIVLTQNKTFVKEVETGAANFFGTRLRRPIPKLSQHHNVAAIGVLDRSEWGRLLIDAMETLHEVDDTEFRGERERLHLVLGTPTLWSFALGMLMRNRYAVVLYHYQVSDEIVYHRIWQIDRRVKDLRSPKAGRKFEYRFFLCSSAPAVATAAKVVPAAPLAACLVFQVGANQIEASVRRFRDTNLPGATMQVFTKRYELSPKEPRMWVRAAAEIAHAVCNAGPTGVADVYLFVDMPSVLGLMAGDAIGSYQAQRLHLMQWDAANSTYHETLSFPNEELGNLAG